MAISLKHNFTSPKGDGPDATLVQPSNWNEEHVLTQATARLLGRTSSGTGPTEEISVGSRLSFAGGVLDGSAAPTYDSITVNGVIAGSAIASKSSAETGTDNDRWMTPLRTREAMQFFGLGEATAAPLISNLDADVPSGFYRTSSATTGAFPPGVAATTGYVSVYRDASNRIMQVFATANGANTELHMRKFDAGWAAWNTYTPAAQLTQAQAEDPASTVFGTVSGQRLEQQTNAAFNVSGSAPKYACRAWVNFNGTTTPPTIRASGNVSSVTRNGTGNYTVNFTTAMPDANYVITCESTYSGTGGGSWENIETLTTTSASFSFSNTNLPGNPTIVVFAAFR
jgi:hypothetical protein